MAYSVLLIGPFTHAAQQLMFQLGTVCAVTHTQTAKDGYEILEKTGSFSAVLLDLQVEDEDGFEVLETIKARYPIVEVIVLSPTKNSALAIEAMRLRAYAFELYSPELCVITRYLSQIADQFDLFKIAETVCRNNMVQEMDVRVDLSLEFLMKRRLDGFRLAKEELSVFFPITDTDESVDLLHKQLERADVSQRKTGRLLLVEDEEAVAGALRLLLGTKLKHHVTLASSKAEALQILDTDADFHIAILDIGLKDGWGTELIEPVLAKSPYTQIIMLTAFDDTVNIVNSFHLGASDYVPKPYDDYQLQQVVSKAAQRYVYKSFLPSTSWKPITATNETLEIRLKLLNELVTMREGKKKLILDRELDVFKISREQLNAI